eukprot:GFUD01113600.1.p1 GENE.GFUD01113600.1~~GFUD01113600.1.p1  ORF type:complete len:387 (-),score=98.52 GFUD01113600.1:43-1203(-)
MGSEKFCLRWNDFETNISVAFRELREEKDFFDVTLACDDSQIQAHKVILSACSPFFRNVLRRNPHQHPLLYLKGVKYKELLSVLNFMYMGEVNVAQEELNSFLAVAEDLRVKGLTQNNSSAASTKPFPKQEAPKQIIRPRDPPERDPVPPPKRPRPSPPAPPAAVVQQVSAPVYQQEDDDIQEVMPVKTEPRDPAPQAVSTSQPPALASPAPIQHTQAIYHSQDEDQGTVALDESYAAEESYDYGYEGYDDGSGMIDPNTGMPFADNGADKGQEKKRQLKVKDIDIKKDLIKKIGQAKQCQLCKKLFSSEYKAIAHIHEDHNDINMEAVEHLLGKSNDMKTVEEVPKWKCSFCGITLLKMEEAVVHLKELHSIVNARAVKRSLNKV